MDIPFYDLSKTHSHIQNELEQNVLDVVRSNWFIQGSNVTEFEKEYAGYSGVKHCIGISNGLDALRVIITALDLPPGSEIIVPANSFIASALAISYEGYRPVLADVREETFLIDPDRIEAAITEKTRAIMPVHLTGSCCDMDAVLEIAEHHNLYVIEDNAQAHGCIYKGRMTGSMSIASGTSFYPGKNLGALGDAGAVTTDNDALAEKIRAFINYGTKTRYHHIYKGYNTRLDEIQAAALRVKLRHLEDWNKQRRRLAARYMAEIKNELIELPQVPFDCVWHLFMLRVKNGRRDELREYLEFAGIHTLIHYPIPISRQKAYAGEFDSDLYPVADKLAGSIVSIPLFPYMEDEQQRYVIETITEWK